MVLAKVVRSFRRVRNVRAVSSVARGRLQSTVGEMRPERCSIVWRAMANSPPEPESVSVTFGNFPGWTRLYAFRRPCLKPYVVRAFNTQAWIAMDAAMRFHGGNRGSNPLGTPI